MGWGFSFLKDMCGFLSKIKFSDMCGEFGFSRAKRRKNNTCRQEIARKILRFSDFRSPLPPQ